MNIEFKVIPHAEHRYPTVGDYWWDEDDDDTLHVRVSKMSDERYEKLVFLHELVECLLCKWMGVDEEKITAFDEEYEKNRAEDDDSSEPGNCTDAPYAMQHAIATGVERLAAVLLGVNWDAYDKEVMSL